MNRKKIILILIIIILILGLVFILIFRKKDKSAEETTNNTESATYPTKQINNSKSDFVKASETSKEIIFYDRVQDKIYKYDYQTEEKTAITKNMQSADIIQKISYSPNLKQFYLTTFYNENLNRWNNFFTKPDLNLEDGQVNLWYYNTNDKKLKILSDNIINNPSENINNPYWINNSQVLYVYMQNTNPVLVKASPNTSYYKIITSVKDSFYSIVNYDDKKNILIYSSLINNEEPLYEIYSMNLKTKKSTKLLGNVQYYSASDNNLFIFNTGNNSYIYDINEKKQTKINILVDECTIKSSATNNKIICLSNNSLYLVDKNSPEKSTKINTDINYQHISNLQISHDITKIFFTADDYLYQINLE